jgi:hypothetical protein
MQRAHNTHAAVPDVSLQGGGLQIFFNVHIRKTLPDKPLNDSYALWFRLVELSPVPRTPKRQDHGNSDASRQAPCRCLLDIRQVVHAKLQKIDVIAEVLRMSQICLKGLLGQDEADFRSHAQKSLLKT